MDYFRDVHIIYTTTYNVFRDVSTTYTTNYNVFRAVNSVDTTDDMQRVCVLCTPFDCCSYYQINNMKKL